jgi:dUTP pyrophosphatase
MELKVQRIHEDAKLPLYQHKGDAGLDIFSAIDCVLEAGEVKPISTGIRVAVPEGYVGLVWDKSGISRGG